MNEILSSAERLQRLRKELGYNQRDLAREFRVSHGAVSLWESGARAIPNPVMLLIELYESHLNLSPPASNEPDSRLEELSDRIVESLFTVVRGRKSPKAERQKKIVRRAVRSYLKRQLSFKNSTLRTVQIALLRRLIDSVGAVHGLPVKIAQVASYIDPTISPKVRDLLSTLQDQARPISAAEAARVIQEELGGHPHSLFAEWNPKPFAAASLGQVHLARLKSGERVAVKIQYPGVAKRIQRQFQALSFVNSFRNLVRANEDSIFKEIRDRVLDECDYRLEAESQESFRTIFSDDAHVFIPRVFHELSSHRVLTMEYFEGQKLGEFSRSASQEDRNVVGETLVRFHSRAIFLHCMANGDPHPGNYLFSGDKVCFLDFGRVKRFSSEELAGAKSLYLSVFRGDRELTRHCLESQRMVKSWSNFDFDGFWAATRILEHHHIFDGTFRFTPEHVIRQVTAAKSYRGWRELRPNTVSLWGIAMNASLWNMLAELRAESNWRKNSLPFVCE